MILSRFPNEATLVPLLFGMEEPKLLHLLSNLLIHELLEKEKEKGCQESCSRNRRII